PPATTANLGPGFDAFGMAFALSNRFTIAFADRPTFIGTDKKYQNTDNIVYRACQHVFLLQVGREIPISIAFETQIPTGRGLGSSASCIIAGLAAANALCDNPYTKEELLNMATEMEGHPDNVAPALYGGLTVSSKTDQGIFTKRMTPHSSYRYTLLVPDRELKTAQSRQEIEQNVRLQDAIDNIANGALMIQSLADGDPSALKVAARDKLYESRRKKAIPDFDRIKEQALNSGYLCCVISGAGPTLLCISKTEKDNAETSFPFPGDLAWKWQSQVLPVDLKGCQIKLAEGGFHAEKISDR
ncbi:MAG TPA: homoserine kinase, partial [Eubacteriaceae bacterium]|nr:homoserine kinase [Eubacteriaceae bacterium]